MPTAENIDEHAVDTSMEAMLATSGAPGAAIAIVRGDAAYMRGYGVRAKGKGEAVAVTADTLFACASTTKAVTTASMALLVGEGKMGWDDPVRKYLPEFRLSDPLADACVTLRDLVSHRTGLPRHDKLWYRSPWDRAEILRRTGYAKLNGTFRQKYQYQNICFMAAGETVRVASGAESWEAFVQERMLAPLGMDRTSFRHQDAEQTPDHATPHLWVKGKIQTTPWLNFDNIGPAGTMNSCANDMGRWIRFQLAGGVLPDSTQLIDEKALKETKLPQMVIPIDDDTRERYPYMNLMSYGMGWTLWNYRNGVGIVSHSGAINGFRAHVALAPAEQLGVAILINVGGPGVELMRNALLDLLLGLPIEKDWNAILKTEVAKIETDRKKAEKERREQRKNGKESPLPPAAFVGIYEDPAYGTVTVAKEKSKKGGGLTIQWNQFESPLRHQTFTTYRTTTEEDGFEDVEVRFRIDAGGDPDALFLFDGEFAKQKAK